MGRRSFSREFKLEAVRLGMMFVLPANWGVDCESSGDHLGEACG
jgi:hypothetical protein